MLNRKYISTLNKNLAKVKILVVGDVMLDRYWFGQVNRISPEAPVPIAKIDKIEDRPGGAANVARNITSLGGNATLLSVVGIDEPSITLEKLLDNEKVETIFKKDSNVNTVVKLRVLAKNQQLIRIDFEEKPSHEILAEILDTYQSIVENYELVILSDYGKGGLYHTSQMIKIARACGKKVLIDPKGSDYLKYQNATLITPNLSELCEAIGKWNNEEELYTKANLLRERLNLEYILITRSEDGMTLFDGNKAYNFPTSAQEVYDVSGAGDTVIATTGLMLANQLSIQDSIKIANFTAGLVVAKLGTATITKNELIEAINN